jgi:hypothetical protein
VQVAVATEPEPLRAVELEHDSVWVGPVAAIVHVGVPVGVIPSVPVTVTVKVSVLVLLLSEPATAAVGAAFAMVTVMFWVAFGMTPLLAFAHTV